MIGSKRLRQFALLLADIVVLFAALFATLWLRRGLEEAIRTYGVHARYFAVVFAVLLLVYYTSGFYDLERDFDDPRFFGKVLWTSILCALFGALYFYLDYSAPIGPRGVLALDAVMTTLFVSVWRSSYSRISRKVMPRRRVAFVGNDPALPEIVAEIKAHPSHGYETAAFYEEGDGPPLDAEIRHFREAESCIGMAENLGISLVVIADERSLSEETRMALISLMGPEIRFVRLDSFYEYLLRKIPSGLSATSGSSRTSTCAPSGPMRSPSAAPMSSWPERGSSRSCRSGSSSPSSSS